MIREINSPPFKYDCYFCVLRVNPDTLQKTYVKNWRGKIRTFKTFKRAQKYTAKRGLNPISSIVKVSTTQELKTQLNIVDNETI